MKRGRQKRGQYGIALPLPVLTNEMVQRSRFCPGRGNGRVKGAVAEQPPRDPPRTGAGRLPCPAPLGPLARPAHPCAASCIRARLVPGVRRGFPASSRCLPPGHSHTQKNFLSRGPIPLPRGCRSPRTPQHEGCPGENPQREGGNLFRKRNRRFLSHRLAQSSRDCADETELKPQSNAAQPREGGAWGGDGSLGPSGHRRRGVSAGLRLTPGPPAPGGTAHLRRGSRCNHRSPRRARSRPPRQPAHPAVIPRAERPERSGVGRIGVERSAEKRRGDVRPPRRQSHPKGERKNDRETRRGWRGEAKAARQASSRLPVRMAWALRR